MEELKQKIEHYYENKNNSAECKQAVLETLEQLNRGEIRVASPVKQGVWQVHAWVKKAILLYFGQATMQESTAGDLSFYDKIPVRTDHSHSKIRVVPPAVYRYGAFLEPGVILMPAYVNIGARVGRGSMVDTWATVGSCAQIGAGVHISGGVGIGGVLEPPQGQPVIVEDGAFLGSRCIIVEGIMIEERAVLGANVTLTASTPIIDVTGQEPVEYRGRVPAGSVVIPGSREKKFPAGNYQIPCALIIGKRNSRTDDKTSLEEALREYSVAV